MSVRSDDGDVHAAQWVDRTYKASQMSGSVGYLMAWGCIVMGVYLLALWIEQTAFIVDHLEMFRYFGDLLFGLFFLGTGILGISMTRNLANRVRVIDFLEDGFRIRFWWRLRRKDIEFTISDVESVEPCRDGKNFIERMAKEPREPICYHVKVRGQKDFIVTGTDETIHEIVKRFSPTER